ncbi:hypothetical protein K1719_020405 [Acacia pycnantha]|nr:hypothetical protein K1719_020405 [Acacia pycnantha]
MINTGKMYDKSQLKNKYDSLRNQGQCWDRLLKETGVGCDYEKKTIPGDDDCRYEKFRDEGLQFQEELTQLFSSVVATRPNQWAPSSKTLPTTVRPKYDLEEGSGDSDEVLRATTGLSANINAFNLTSHSGGNGSNTHKGKGKASSRRQNKSWL